VQPGEEALDDPFGDDLHPSEACDLRRIEQVEP
jgi:hypothetical protein